MDFPETVFADDFNVFKRFNRGKLSQARRAEIEVTGAQKQFNLWGEGKPRLFDPSTESFHVSHRRLHNSTKFKLLGALLDFKLLMQSAARSVATEAGWRRQQVFKSHSLSQQISCTYTKAQVLSYCENRIPAIY